MTKTIPRPLPTRIAFALLWLFVFMLPLSQLTELPVLSAVSKLLGLLAMVAGVIAVVARRQVRTLDPVHMAMASFILWSAVTLCWSVAPQLTVQRIMTDLQLFVVVMLVWEMCSEEKHVLQILSAFVLGTIIPALSTLKAYLPGDETLFRRASAGTDPNALAFMLALSLPVAYYLILREKRPISALYRLQMGFAVCAILLSGSGASMIAMAVGLSIVCWTVDLVSIRTRNSAFAIVMLLVLTGILFMPAGVWQHISEESRIGGITMTSVLDTVRSTPVGGLGAGTTLMPVNPVQAAHGAATQTTAGQKPEPHSSFTMFTETGVIGIVCYIALLGVLVLAAERMSGANKSLWFTVLAVWTVGVCALSWEATQPAWLLFGLLAAHSVSLNQAGISTAEQARKRNYYVEQGAEVWS